MNHPALIFTTLSSAFQRDAASEIVDILAAELTAQVARASGPVCVGLIKREAVPRFFGLVFLLDQYGLILRKRYRQQGDGVFVFLEPKKEVPSEFAGAVVREKPVVELAQAA